ncbi:hypothetical protein MAPG_00229 [Magnaporthiopsis poae ATCC 64411]|uniref:Uncharacterized protein n=1 Tax=Magnaporthiopsis poae (strain ATCC 64411 / 73-15) TaxID=644358 RepID=A0A0C4DKF8_MAGP6|nr:hypothetical protein MAPG_00229 [Magnaporthiopsis poae ATCC 64411]
MIPFLAPSGRRPSRCWWARALHMETPDVIGGRTALHMGRGRQGKGHGEAARRRGSRQGGSEFYGLGVAARGYGKGCWRGREVAHDAGAKSEGRLRAAARAIWSLQFSNDRYSSGPAGGHKDELIRKQRHRAL